MKTLVALLRAVNVGGTGKLAMPHLTLICADAGFADVRTYIQSGNVVFRTRLSPGRARTTLEQALAKATGTRIDVIVREATELRDVLANVPFPGAPPARVVVYFCSHDVPPGVDGLRGPDGEQVRAFGREIYVFFPIGQGASKLKLPKLGGAATARNINTVTRLVQMCT